MIKIIPQYISGSIIPSFKKKLSDEGIATNPLERTPATDTFETNKSETKKVSSVAKKKVNNYNQKQLLSDLELVLKENILGDEINFLLQPKTNAAGEKQFTQKQARIITLAAKKILFFKDAAKSIEKDGMDSIDEVLKNMKKVFGGEKEFGKYLKAREHNGKPVPKDAISIYNKLIKEFKSEYIEGDVLNSFAKELGKKSYKQLDKTEREYLKLCILSNEIKLDTRGYKALEESLKATSSKDFKKSVSWVKDLIGVRLILPDDVDMKKVEEYLTKAIIHGKLRVTRVSNYHANHIYPYISKDTAKLWQQSSPGMLVVSSSDVRKKNGYTTTQLNIEYEIKDKQKKVKTILVELQIRSEKLNYLGQIEHLIYDILEGKDISKGIPELQEFYDSKGIVKAVNAVFNDPIKENAYLEYEKTTYARIRNQETKNKHILKEEDFPILADFGLGQYDVLSFESLDYIDKIANRIKKKYGNKK